MVAFIAPERRIVVAYLEIPDTYQGIPDTKQDDVSVCIAFYTT